MSNKKVLTFAALGVALVSLISAAEKNPGLKKELEAFKVEFDSYGSGALELTSDLAEAGGIIADLKKQLEAALEVKEITTEKLTVTVDKVKYLINHGAFPHTAKEIAESAEIAKEILKIKGQNAISKL